MYPRNLQNPNTVGRVEKLGVGNGGGREEFIGSG
jgi:hypothetical protein